MAAAKKSAPVSMVTVRLLEPVIRDGETYPAGAEIEVSERRAQIWREGGVCE